MSLLTRVVHPLFDIWKQSGDVLKCGVVVVVVTMDVNEEIFSNFKRTQILHEIPPHDPCRVYQMP